MLARLYVTTFRELIIHQVSYNLRYHFQSVDHTSGQLDFTLPLSESSSYIRSAILYVTNFRELVIHQVS